MDAQMPLKMYKFMPSQFVQDFLDKGTVKIGTAAEYRQPDSYNDGRSDTEELRRVFAPGNGTFRLIDIPVLRDLAGADYPDNVMVSFEDSTITNEADMYMFCASSKITKLLIKGMAEKFGCDACVEIKDMYRFAYFVTNRALQLQESDMKNLAGGRFLGNPIKYVTFDPTIGSSNSPFEKRRQFWWQREFRIVWAGKAPRSGFLVDVPEIPEFRLARRVDLTRY